MNKYYSESMVSAMQAMSEVESLANTARRISDEFQSEISRALRPAMNQAAYMQIAIKPMSFDLSAIKMQTQINNSLVQQMKELSEELQRPAAEVFKGISITNDILSQINMRSTIYNVSTINIDDSFDEEEVESIKDFQKSSIAFSPIAAHETLGIMNWTYTTHEFLSDPTMIAFFMLLVSYAYNNALLLNGTKDEE